MSSYMTKEITTALKDYYVRANETERIILNSALAAAAADAVGGIMPGHPCHHRQLLWRRVGDVRLLVLHPGNLPEGKRFKAAGTGRPRKHHREPGGPSDRNVRRDVHPWRLYPGQKSSDPYTFSDISSSEMKAAARNITVTKEDLNAAKAVYEANPS